MQNLIRVQELQRQRVYAAGTVCRTGTDNHKLSTSAEGQIKDDLAKPTLQTLALLRLRPFAPKGPVLCCAVHPSYAQCQLQHRPQAGPEQILTLHQACCEEKRGTSQEASHQQATGGGN